MRFLGLVILLQTFTLAQSTLRLKVPLPVEGISGALRAAQAANTIPGPVASGWEHRIVQFEEAPTGDTVRALEARGVEVLADVPDNALLVAVERTVAVGDLGVSYAAALSPESKISPLIAAGLEDLTEFDAGGYYVVEFHPDVEMGEARRIVLEQGLELRENPDLGAGRLLVRKRVSRRAANPLPRLAEQDGVGYIFPASRSLVSGSPVARCVGAITEHGVIAQYIAAVGEGWDGAGRGATVLDYSFGQGSSKLPDAAAWGEVTRAMQEWSKVIQLTWRPGSGAGAPRTIHVMFGRGAHGDNYPFDGQGTVLAHTYYPSPPNPEPIAGDMHLDDDEGWRIGANVDLYSVALHELGHALGLSHSDDPNAVMYPYYRMASTLAEDDRDAILRLYAAAVEGSDPPVPPVDPPVSPPADPPSEPDPPVNPPADPPSQPDPPSGPPSNPDTPSNPPDGPAAPSGDRTPPAMAILAPTSVTISTSRAEFEFRGTASDASGIASVTWSSLGSTGAASGTTNWSAKIPLLVGFNRVTIRVTDTAGNESWRTVVVTRR